MDQVAVATLAAPNLDGEDVIGWAIEIVERKRGHERVNVAHRECHDEVHVVSHPRFTIDDPRGTTGDHVREAERVEALHERPDQIRYLHAGTLDARELRPVRQSTRDGGLARE